MYKSGKYIYRQKYNLHISAHCIISYTYLLPHDPPYKEIAP